MGSRAVADFRRHRRVSGLERLARLKWLLFRTATLVRHAEAATRARRGPRSKINPAGVPTGVDCASTYGRYPPSAGVAVLPSSHPTAAEPHPAPSRARLLRWRVLGAAAALPLAVLGAAWPRWPAHARHEQRAPRATGRVEGLVVISKALAARRPRFRLYAGDGAAMLPPAAAEPNERDNVIVYLTPVSGDSIDDARPPASHAEMRQQGERFVPHVLPVVRGTTVDFPNEDVVFHNVFSLSSARSFDLGRYPRGGSKSILFDRVGTVQVFCHIHSDMSAIVLVLPNPFFARPDSTGHFALDVPAGDYIVTGWHERIRPITRRLHVEPGRTQTVDFDIPLPPDEQHGS